jgi:glucan phosphoethanolaminetransferase (alkaline phosphatase superfamily)
MRTTPKYNSENIPDSLTVIVVLGEAVRADHLQLNGYKRETTPKLMRRKNIVSLPNIYSPYTNTTSSIPHIITRADSAHADYAYTEHSFVTIFRQEHFNTVWLSNQDLAKALYDFLLEPDTVIYTQAAIQQSLYGKWLDGELLPIFEKSLNHPKQLIILHTVGSHWLYDTHVTDDFYVFHPTISNRDVRLNTIEQIVNSYDNSIVYMDSFLDTIIKKIENRPAILLYLSDHGESLGEGGRFLHAQEDAEEEKRPAAIIWYSDQYEYLFPQKVAALKSNHLNHYRTDYLYHSVLSAAGIEISGENSGLDIFR